MAAQGRPHLALMTSRGTSGWKPVCEGNGKRRELSWKVLAPSHGWGEARPPSGGSRAGSTAGVPAGLPADRVAGPEEGEACCPEGCRGRACGATGDGASTRGPLVVNLALASGRPPVPREAASVWALPFLSTTSRALLYAWLGRDGRRAGPLFARVGTPEARVRAAGLAGPGGACPWAGLEGSCRATGGA